jgi:hypothetical protein
LHFSKADSPEDYEDSIIPEGVDPDIVRTEKQLDFEEACGMRYRICAELDTSRYLYVRKLL